MSKTRVLFVCTHNSARSQMAEAFLRELGGDEFDVQSAGTRSTVVHPFSIQAMAEVGIDISLHDSKSVDRFLGQTFDLVITVCDDAAETCPVFPGNAKRKHWSFPDPSAATGDDEQRFSAFVRVRDEIRARIERELIPTGSRA